MRFVKDGPVIPDHLLEARDAGQVVFLCGAGVSIPAGMPTFIGLARYVIDQLCPPASSNAVVAFGPWRDSSDGPKRPLDDVFNLLVQEFGRETVVRLVTERLMSPSNAADPSHHHDVIARLSADQAGLPRIVTTNFDHLFDGAASRMGGRNHEPRSFPDLRHGVQLSGVTYLHGRLSSQGGGQPDLVLTSSDFGEAYLSKAWATEFIRELLNRYIVVLVGYQAEDPPMKYLLQGLNKDGNPDRSRLFAFDRGTLDEVNEKWKDRPVTAIAYPGHGHDHSALWDTLIAWAGRADDPRSWRSSVVEMARRGPQSLEAHERGMVAHLIRTQPGAKLFANAEPPVTPEWLCVFDSWCRKAKPSSSYGENAETFDPLLFYGLDDDPPRQQETGSKSSIVHDDLLLWRPGDENPSDQHRLGGTVVTGYEQLPPRLDALGRWIGRNADSPIVAWWAARWSGLHPQLLRSLTHEIRRSDNLTDDARQLWNVILEVLHAKNTGPHDIGWYDLRERVKREGWTPNVLREYEQINKPRFKVDVPMGLGKAKPPLGDWTETKSHDVAGVDVEFPSHHGDPLNIPDKVLPQVWLSAQQNAIRASSMLSERQIRWFATPTCYPTRDVGGDGDSHPDESAMFFTFLVELLGRLALANPGLVKSHSETWPAPDRFFFDKLHLFIWNDPQVFTAAEVAKNLIEMDHGSFWNFDLRREMLFLLHDRWNQFNPDERGKIVERLLDEPDRVAHETDEDDKTNRPEIAARYLAWLNGQGCQLSPDEDAKLAALKLSISNWMDGWASSVVTLQTFKARWVGTDENPTPLIGLPIGEIVSAAITNSTREWESLTERRPFQGLVKAHPGRALAALAYAAKRGQFPTDLWSALVSGWPDGAKLRLTRLFCHRISRLPPNIMVEMHHTIGNWLRDKYPSLHNYDPDLANMVFDRFVGGLVSDGGAGIESGFGTVSVGGVPIKQSRRTFDHAINGPIGQATEGIWSVLTNAEFEKGSGLPAWFTSRIERLLAAPDEGSDHAICMLTQFTSWLHFVDPQWTIDRVIPWFNLAHPASEPAWNGILWCNDMPTPEVWALIKPAFLGLFPHIYQWDWGDRTAERAHDWVVLAAAFSSDEIDGITFDQARDAVRNMNDAGRQHLIHFIGRVGKENDDGWNRLALPFIQKSWPREVKFQTDSASRAWVSMLDDAGAAFPAVLRVVRPFLVPIRVAHHWLFGFTREMGGDEPLSLRFPAETLDMLSCIIADEPRDAPYDLAKVLDTIREADPTLEANFRFRRLADIVSGR
ncbi:MAG: SIR2 family protein [Pseudomonadota bacterium]